MSIITDILEFLGLVEPDTDDTQTSARVLIKIVDAIDLNLNQGDTLTLNQLASKAGAAGAGPPVDMIRAITPDIVFARAFDSLTPTDIKSLVTVASDQDPSYEPFKFDNALEAVFAPGFDTSELVAALNNWTGVMEYAYTGADASDPIVTGTGNPLFNSQGYFNPADIGIGVQSAWAKGADGTGTSFIDLEQGWFLNHVDLPPGIPLLAGTNSRQSFYHGAAVLGMLVAQDNTLGIVGAAPNARAQVMSYFDPRANPKLNAVQRIHDRILKCLDPVAQGGENNTVFGLGDVLQIEAQFTGFIGTIKTLLPVEFEPLVFQAIRIVTAIGIIVVEAAGNGGDYPNAATKKMDHHGTDLDTFVDKDGKRVLSRSTPADFKDSGAIMVTGSVTTLPHTRQPDLNFGSRIDCYAWGDNIVTCFWDSQTPNARDLYMGVGRYKNLPFKNTSGATPIITGACLLTQHLQTLLTPKGRPAGRIKSTDMRTILSKVTNGTESAAGAAIDKIGMMPDFVKILANEFMP